MPTKKKIPWFGPNTLGHLIAVIIGRDSAFAHYVKDVLDEVYENLEDIDKRVESLEQSKIDSIKVVNGVLVIQTEDVITVKDSTLVIDLLLTTA